MSQRRNWEVVWHPGSCFSGMDSQYSSPETALGVPRPAQGHLVTRRLEFQALSPIYRTVPTVLTVHSHTSRACSVHPFCPADRLMETVKYNLPQRTSDSQTCPPDSSVCPSRGLHRRTDTWAQSGLEPDLLQGISCWSENEEPGLGSGVIRI